MCISPDKKCCHKKTACKAVVWLITYVGALLLPFVCPAPVTAETAPQSPGRWQISSILPAGEGGLTLSLKAEKEVKGWMKTSIPVLTIQCVKGKASVYVETGMGLEVTMVDQQIVRLQLDGSKPFAQRWREITNATISAREAAALIKQLVQSQKLIFEFTPFNSAPAQAEFAVAGLSAYLPQIANACWEK